VICRSFRRGDSSGRVAINARKRPTLTSEQRARKAITELHYPGHSLIGVDLCRQWCDVGELQRKLAFPFGFEVVTLHDDSRGGSLESREAASVHPRAQERMLPVTYNLCVGEWRHPVAALEVSILTLAETSVTVFGRRHHRRRS
jgi:hypothetical protein